ncbi:MAG: stringent starvation protein B [Pseudomonadales bacterium]|jgi:stringent starvation protein B
MATIPRRSYLLRAMIDWIVDCGHTPYVLVDASVPGVSVPAEHVKDGRIVLNLAPAAVRNLAIDQRALGCDGRFSGRAFALYLPMASIAAVYSRETGDGMVFEPEDFPSPDDPAPRDELPPGGGGAGTPSKISHLKRVK